MDTRDTVFDRVLVDFLVKGVTRVSWALRCGFVDGLPHLYQLQVGSTGNPNADDWEDVGDAAENIGYATDDERRTYSHGYSPYYRVKLVTPDRTAYSVPAPAYGILDKRYWLLARNAVRLERQRLKFGHAWRGQLLKRRWRGELTDVTDPVNAATDYLTGAVVQSHHPETHGTPYLGGYFAPMPLVLDISPLSRYNTLDSNAEGTVNKMVTRAYAPAIPELQNGDVFVHEHSDRRYFIHRARDLAVFNGVPLLTELELRQAPTTDAIYDVELS